MNIVKTFFYVGFSRTTKEFYDNPSTATAVPLPLHRDGLIMG